MSDLEGLLAALAAKGETITYGSLARDLGWRMGALTAALETLMEEDARKGHPLRASLCAARLGNGQPAPGFFEKARSLGYAPTDDSAFVAEHRADLYHAETARRAGVVADKPQPKRA